MSHWIKVSNNNLGLCFLHSFFIPLILHSYDSFVLTLPWVIPSYLQGMQLPSVDYLPLLVFIKTIQLLSTLAYCPRPLVSDITISQASIVLLPTCQRSTSLSRPLPFLSLLANSPQFVHQIERSLSHVYGHIQTSTITDTPTLLLNSLALLVVDTSISTLTAIARNYTRRYFHWNNITSKFPFKDNCTHQFVYSSLSKLSKLC